MNCWIYVRYIRKLEIYIKFWSENIQNPEEWCLLGCYAVWLL
jgi:hypothetical protein